MWLRMLELIYAPFVLLLISYNSKNDSLVFQRKPTVKSVPEVVNSSYCQERNVSLLYYDHPNPEIRGCYEENGREPCGEYMRLYSINGSRNGECDCDVDDLTYLRILLFHNETNRCYPIFTQGYCENGEQLLTTKENPLVPVCQRTACYRELRNPVNKGKDLVPYRNNTTCVTVGSTCGSAGFFVIGFKRNNVYPSCIRARGVGRGIGVPSVRCSPGTYRAMTGHCQPPAFTFDDWD